MSQEDAQLTIDNATQRCVRKTNPSLKRDFSTNYRMLRCKRLDKYFYMDTFHATESKTLNSLRKNTCCKLFVTDKG